MRIPKPSEMHIVIMAYAYARQGCLLSLIALNSATKVDTVLKQPRNPSCMPVAMVSQLLVFTYIVQKTNISFIFLHTFFYIKANCVAV